MLVAALLSAICLVGYCAAAAVIATTPTGCVQKSTTFFDLANCFQRFIKKSDTITESAWNTTINPTAEERNAWIRIVRKLLSLSATTVCPTLGDDESEISLVGKYAITPFPTAAGNISRYCLLYETNVISVQFNGSTIKQFERGWSWVAVSKKPTRYLHLSGAHPLFDVDVDTQAAGVFDQTGAKSLIVASSHRTAYNKSSSCHTTNTKTGRYENVRMTDPAHEPSSLFHAALVETKSWQETESNIKGCVPFKCLFLQFHGKGKNACTDVNAFISVGYRNDSVVYSPQSAVMKLRDNVQKELDMEEGNATYKAGTPVTSNCDLTGGSNVFARLVNGVAEKDLCNDEVDVEKSKVAGVFVHVEQLYKPVASWARAINNTINEI